MLWAILFKRRVVLLLLIAVIASVSGALVYYSSDTEKHNEERRIQDINDGVDRAGRQWLDLQLDRIPHTDESVNSP